MARITATVAQANPALVGPWGTSPALMVLSWLFVFSLGNVGMPHSTSRFLMIKNPAQLRFGVVLATAAYMVGSSALDDRGFRGPCTRGEWRPARSGRR